LLERELARPGYVPKTIALGAVTDPYQPIERDLAITRSILEVLERTSHPVGIVTKSAGVLRDLDILTHMARERLVRVAISVTTLDRALARSMEPRAATPPRRLEAIRRLSEAGVPVTAMVAPIVPALNDSEIEAIIEAAAEAGAKDAGYVLLRLPLELKSLFREWLETDHPGRAARVISLLRSMHGGRDYVSDYGHRQRGSGPYAEQIAARFRLAMKRHGLGRSSAGLRTDLFRRPVAPGGQLSFL
jgi:DNA repair photolyase